MAIGILRWFREIQPHIVFAIDVSGSTGETHCRLDDSGMWIVWANSMASIIDLELSTAIALSEQLIAQGRGDTTQIGVVLWGTTASHLGSGSGPGR